MANENVNFTDIDDAMPTEKAPEYEPSEEEVERLLRHVKGRHGSTARIADRRRSSTKV